MYADSNEMNCNYQTVSGLPEAVVETVITPEDFLKKKTPGQKKKNRERGKVTQNWRVASTPSTTFGSPVNEEHDVWFAAHNKDEDLFLWLF